MRSFIRHPANIPLEFETDSNSKERGHTLRNVSTGGLCFISETAIKKGTQLKINIPNLRSEFVENCIVVWCRKKKAKYEIGVKFLDDQTTFRMRMVEQICYIENYRKEVFSTEGRKLTAKEASDEWIAKFAKEFPRV